MKKQSNAPFIYVENVNLTINENYDVHNPADSANSLPEDQGLKGLSRSETARRLIKKIRKNKGAEHAFDQLVGMYKLTIASLIRMFAIPKCDWIFYRYCLMPEKLMKLIEAVDVTKADERLDAFIKKSLRNFVWHEKNGDKPLSIDPRHACLMNKVRLYILDHGGSIDYDISSPGLRHAWGEKEYREAADELGISVKKLKNTIYDLQLENLFYIYPADDLTDGEEDNYTCENMMPDEKFNPETLTIRNEESKRLHNAIKDSGLTPMEAQTLFMHYGLDDGYPKSFKEISELMMEDWGVSNSTVKRANRRALEKLKGIYGEKNT